MNSKERFIELYKSTIKREGAAELLDFLLSPSSDFFEAPASARFHLSKEGGLCEHSLNVYDCLKSYLDAPRTKEITGMTYSEESIAIVSATMLAIPSATSFLLAMSDSLPKFEAVMSAFI